MNIPRILSSFFPEINDRVEAAIKKLYSSFLNIDSRTDDRNHKSLLFFHSIQNLIEARIFKISKGENINKEKFTTSTISRILSLMKPELKECFDNCVDNVCSSCGSNILLDTKNLLLSSWNVVVKETNPKKADDEIIRKNLMDHIDKMTSDCQQIFVKKIKTGNITKCEEEKLEIHGKLR